MVVRGDNLYDTVAKTSSCTYLTFSHIIYHMTFREWRSCSWWRAWPET